MLLERARAEIDLERRVTILTRAVDLRPRALQQRAADAERGRRRGQRLYGSRRRLSGCGRRRRLGRRAGTGAPTRDRGPQDVEDTEDEEAAGRQASDQESHLFAGQLHAAI